MGGAWGLGSGVWFRSWEGLSWGIGLGGFMDRGLRIGLALKEGLT